MERAHKLLAAGTLEAKDGNFWCRHWHHIASAKVPLEMKIAAYRALSHRGIVTINDVHFTKFYEMVLADRAFVAALDLDMTMMYCYRLCIIWIDDDGAALASYNPDPANDSYASMSENLTRILMKRNAPRCIRFTLQDVAHRESIMRERMPPLVQQLAEELVQPMDWLDRRSLLLHGQSVKLIGLCVPDDELVWLWLNLLESYPLKYHKDMSVPFVRKLHALATPYQRAAIKTKVLQAIPCTGADESCFELAWLFGLLGPFDPTVQACFLQRNVSLFPAFTFAMIVAMCDGYLDFRRGIMEPQKRFFDFAMRLPMDLQALISLRLDGQASTVISSDKFHRAFLAII
jgi:hypothetical protein